MSVPYDGLVERLRRPEYTGENRCLPCTAVNAAIAVAVGAAAGVFVAPVVGAAVLAVAVSAIWLRGYLVPGTPELTKRYLPPWALALFGKEPSAAGAATDAASPAATDVDPESYLLSEGVLVETDDGTDLAYAPWFESAWREHLADDADDAAAVTRLAGVAEADRESLVVEERGNAVYAAVDGEEIGHWVSRPAFRADVAADRVLRSTDDDWADLPQAARSSVLGGLRLFVEECPSCGGDVSLGEEVVSSCCTTRDVVVARCDGCDARLLEIDPPTPAGGDD